MTTVGVVIPHHNSSHLLLDAVDSALRQTVPAEVIVVDDGSTERGAADVLRAAEARGARVIRKANGGVSSARNVGIAATMADVIIPLDADDKLEPTAAARGLAVMEHHPDISIVCWDQRLFGSKVGLIPCLYAGPESMLTQTTIPNTSMYRRSLWERAGGYPEELDTGEDWAFWMRALRSDAKVHVLHEPLSWYRVSDKQATRALSSVRVARAQNLILLENPDVYPQQMLVDQLIASRSLLAHYLDNYRLTEKVKERLKTILRRGH